MTIRIFAAALGALSLAACGGVEPEINPLYVYNLTDATVTATLDGAPTEVARGQMATLYPRAGEHELVISRDGAEIERHAFATDPTTYEDYVYNVSGAAGFALLDIAGAYEGGGVFGLTADRSFPIEATFFGETFFTLPVEQSTLVITPTSQLPAELPGYTTIKLLCPLTLDVEGDAEEIRAQCIALLQYIARR